MIPLDKQLHIFSGGFLAALLMPFGMPTAWLGVAAAAVLKELWNSTGRANSKADAIIHIPILRASFGRCGSMK